MPDDGKRYLNLRVENPSPQTIPRGFLDFYDWPDASDETLAERGWALDAPPDFDPDWERVERTPNGEGGVIYAVVPADLDHARRAALRILGERANAAEHAPFTFKGVPIPFTEKAQGRIEDYADRAKANPGFAVKDWKVEPGRFVSFSNADLIALGEALNARIQARYAREAAITKKLLRIKSTEKLRAALAEEIDTGWPDQAKA